MVDSTVGEWSVRLMEEASIELEPLATEQRIALAYFPHDLRTAASVVFALDLRISRIVAQTTEPMLGQMRLAWWRDMLSQPPKDRPQGDAVLDAIGWSWESREASLSAMVDGWEHLLGDAPLDEEDLLSFADGRTAPFRELAIELGEKDAAEPIRQAMLRWALADAAANTVDGDERLLMLRMAAEQGRSRYRFGRRFRGFAVLDALARRSIDRGGRPLMEGRGAAFTALRAGLTGR